MLFHITLVFLAFLASEQHAFRCAPPAIGGLGCNSFTMGKHTQKVLLYALANQQSRKLPVTILSGFLGSGKTSLLNHILKSEHGDKRYAVIVNDMSELNIDSQLVKAHVQFQEEELVELSNGCICCTLREDLLREVAILAKKQEFDHLIIESTGVSEPLPVAETFTFETEDGSVETLFDIAEIDTMVTVVDASNFLVAMTEAEDLADRRLQATEEDTRTITDLLISQVEFASVVILNKCDMVDDKQKQRVLQMIRSLNSDAKIIEAINCAIDVKEVIGSSSYDFDKVAASPAWIKALNSSDEKIPETEEYGISSFVYRARRPFHPSRIFDFINVDLAVTGESDNEDEAVDSPSLLDSSSSSSSPSALTTTNPNPASAPKILRSKGFFWLASRREEMYVWSQAGGLFRISPGGLWWADTSEEDWPVDENDRADITADWDESVGDRKQELVIIGTNLDKAAMSKRLDSCLLSDEEMQYPGAWDEMPDPFPAAEALVPVP